MNLAVIGSGGREHAICAKILQSKKVKKVYCFPGNAGTSSIATNVEINFNEFDKIKDFIINKKINLSPTINGMRTLGIVSCAGIGNLNLALR